MILNQLKEVKVNLKKLSNRYGFESESSCKFILVKEEPEEILDLYEYDDLINNDNAIKSEPKLNQMSLDTQFVKVVQEANNQMTYKNEPELNIEATKSEDNTFKFDEQLKCQTCDKQFKAVDMFCGHIVTDHIDGNFCKLCNKELDGSPFKHSVKHVPINYFDEIIQDEKPSDVDGDLNQQTNSQLTEKYCQHCSQYFTDLEMLKVHACPRILSNRTDYDKDSEKEHTEQKTQNSHMETNDTTQLTDPKLKHRCKICSKGFKYNYGLTEHMRIHTGENPFKCNFCSERFRRGANLRVHMETKHLNELPDRKPKFQCNVCLKICRSRHHFNEHSLIHTGEKPFKCEWCSEKFRYKRSMFSHSQTTHAEELANEKPKYLCSECSESFTYQCDFDAHMRGHEDEKKRLQNRTKHECNLCSKKFRYQCNLNKHMSNHANAKRECKICFETFRHNRLLAVHMEKKHINELPDANAQNQCSICKKLLSNQNSLIVHMRSHTGEKPFQCEFCSTSFRYKHLLRVHMERKHIKELPGDQKPKYQCDVCSKIFSFNHTLVSHKRSHTGERPFQCEVCLDKFRYHEGLFNHMQINHYEEMIGNKPNYPCSVCSKTYGYKMMLDIHMKSKHGKELSE